MTEKLKINERLKIVDNKLFKKMTRRKLYQSEYTKNLPLKNDSVIAIYLLTGYAAPEGHLL